MGANEMKDNDGLVSFVSLSEERPIVLGHINALKPCVFAMERMVSERRMVGRNQIHPQWFKKGFFYLHRRCFALFSKERGIFNTRFTFHRLFHGRGSQVLPVLS